MPIVIQDLDGGVTKVVLSGRIDIAGAQEIDLPMSVVGGAKKAVVIDLAGVEFLASIGLRSLVQCAKTVQVKGGRAVLLSPTPPVAEVIRFAGIDELIPIFDNDDEAVAAVKPA
jgi:anti-anti-sigma factor